MGETREERFWKWFEKNHDRLFSFESNRDQIFAELARHLKQVHEVLTFEFGPVVEGKRDFVISADGIRQGFPAVLQLVEAAPKLEKWNLIAFRPPRDIDMVIEARGISLGPDQVWFLAEADGTRVGLALYIEGFSPEREKQLCQMMFLLLDNALGEYAVETQIGFVECNALPPERERGELRPFREIRSVIDMRVH
jgi:hypothetical protein